MKNIFITGMSSGIGLALAKYYLGIGVSVYGVSRRECPIEHSNLKHIRLDLTDYSSYDEKLSDIINNTKQFDLIILNAGRLGRIEQLKNSKLSEIKETLDINLWSQKAMIDFFLSTLSIAPKHIVSMTSGITKSISMGWSGYLISKIALNTLVKLYAEENPETHFTLLSPGIVQTEMLQELSEISREDFPSLSYIDQTKKNGKVLTADQLARRFNIKVQEMRQSKSGSLFDIENGQINESH